MLIPSLILAEAWLLVRIEIPLLRLAMNDYFVTKQNISDMYFEKTFLQQRFQVRWAKKTNNIYSTGGGEWLKFFVLFFGSV